MTNLPPLRKTLCASDIATVVLLHHVRIPAHDGIKTTRAKWPVNKKLESLLLEKFSRVEFEKDLMGGAVMVAAYK